MKMIATFEDQLRIWGYVIGGDIVDFTALVCEAGPTHLEAVGDLPVWDRDAAYLETIELHDGVNGTVPTPESYALPYITRAQLFDLMSTPMDEINHLYLGEPVR